ncbi:MAG: ATP-binding protein [Nevskia sp.]|nr:ATP-binding protein [Nevskia sp.]
MNASKQSFPPCSESLDAVIGFVERRSGELQLPHATCLRLQLVAEELFTNTFRHQPCAERIPATVSIEAVGEEVELVYEDSEPEWNPLLHIDRSHLELPVAQRPVGGLGMVLIQSFAQDLHYERHEGRNRIRVRLRREAG